MFEKYTIDPDFTLQDEELRCSMKTFLKISDQMEDFEFKVILDDRMPDSHVSLSEMLFGQFQIYLKKTLTMSESEN